jgi:hypothetical protein
MIQIDTEVKKAKKNCIKINWINSNNKLPNSFLVTTSVNRATELEKGKETQQLCVVHSLRSCNMKKY